MCVGLLFVAVFRTVEQTELRIVSVSGCAAEFGNFNFRSGPGVA